MGVRGTCADQAEEVGARHAIGQWRASQAAGPDDRLSVGEHAPHPRDEVAHALVGLVHDLEQDIGDLPRVVILRLRNMTAIDATGLHAIERLSDALHRSGRSLLLCGMRDQPARMMERAEFHEHIGSENLLPSVEAALARARLLTAPDDFRSAGQRV